MAVKNRLKEVLEEQGKTPYWGRPMFRDPAYFFGKDDNPPKNLS
jgi:hypothetical protein